MAPKAYKDLQDIIGWYGCRSFKVVDQFLNEVEQCIDRITLTPALYRAVLPGIRRCLMHSFPYIIYFSSEIEAILILRVRSRKQKPLNRYR